MKRAALRLLLALGAAAALAPFWFMLVFATHARTEIFAVPPPLWFGPALADNLRLLHARLPLFAHHLALSLYVALAATAVALPCCSLAAQAFALHDFRGKRTLYVLVLAGLLLPACLAAIPGFMELHALGWLDHARALYLPGAASAFGLFLLRQHTLHAVPRELVDAARLDGCGELGVWWHVVLPHSRGALAVLGLLTFAGSWNSVLGPLVAMRLERDYTLPLALRTLQAPIDTEWGALMAGACIAVLPLLAAFAVAWPRLARGIVR